jgi:hypothetical protein
MQDDGGEDGQQVGEAGRDISSTPSCDVEMLEEQDQELVVGTGTHLDGVVVKTRAKVKHTNSSEKVTVDVLSRRILEYGLVKAERGGVMSWTLPSTTVAWGHTGGNHVGTQRRRS